MKAIQSFKSNKSRRQCLFAIMILTGLAIATFTVLGFNNEFDELFNYSAKEVMFLGLSGLTLGVLLGFFHKMIRFEKSNDLQTN